MHNSYKSIAQQKEPNQYRSTEFRRQMWINWQMWTFGFGRKQSYQTSMHFRFRARAVVGKLGVCRK